jgi:hypothetical protein
VIRRLLALGLAAAAIALQAGCAVTRASADLTIGADLRTIRSVYVVKNPADERDVARLIQDNLARRGLKVETGSEAVPPQPADALVTYVDTWVWDITHYMLELSITVRDPAGYPLARGNSYRTSTARKTAAGMVDEVLTNVFNAKN